MVDQQPFPGRSSRKDDTYIKKLRNFMLRYRAGNKAAREKLAYENLALYFAYQIYERRDDVNYHTALHIESRILSRQSDAEIAAEVCTQPGVVHWYEKLFFHVRDRLNAHDWIVDQVLWPAFDRASYTITDTGGEAVVINRPIAEPHFDCTTKFFAYFGGPFLLDHMLTGFTRGATATSREDVSSWYENQYQNRIAQRATQAIQTFALTKFDVIKLFEIHNQLISIRKNANNKEDNKSFLTKAIMAMVGGMQWGVGREGAKLVKGTVIEKFDDGAAELRDEEMMLLGVGEHPSSVEGVELLCLPEPGTREEREQIETPAPSQS